MCCSTYLKRCCTCTHDSVHQLSASSQEQPKKKNGRSWRFRWTMALKTSTLQYSAIAQRHPYGLRTPVLSRPETVCLMKAKSEEAIKERYNNGSPRPVTQSVGKVLFINLTSLYGLRYSKQLRDQRSKFPIYTISTNEIYSAQLSICRRPEPLPVLTPELHSSTHSTHLIAALAFVSDFSPQGLPPAQLTTAESFTAGKDRQRSSP